MTMNRAALSRALETLSVRRLGALERADAAREGIYAALPEMSVLDSEAARIGIAVARAAAAGERVSLSTLKKRIVEIKKERTRLLEGAGYSPDALEAHYACARCGDTGYVNGKPCSCLLSLVRGYCYDELNALSPLSLSSFADFSLSYYPEKKDADYGVSPRELMSRVLSKCRAFAEGFSAETSGLLMMGGAGLGKTHLALSIAGEVLAAGFGVVYCSASNIFKKLEADYFDRSVRGGGDSLDSLLSCDLLVLDDLGTEFNSPFVTSALYDLLNSRILAKKPTVITTNIVDEELFAVRYGEKISSRLTGCFDTLLFLGDDIRQIKNGM